MGGFNSGRHGGKSTTQGRNTLDVRKLQRDGVLIPGTRFESSWTRNGQPNGAISVIVNTASVNLIYRHGGDTDMNYPVRIERTQCNYGGSRVWWHCHSKTSTIVEVSKCNYGGSRVWWHCPCCNERVVVLYSGKTFSCRHRRQLAYQSDRVSKADKPFRRANQLRMMLGWGGGVASPPGSKPKGMHWKTYGRHLAKLNQHGRDAMASTDKTMARIKSKLASLD